MVTSESETENNLSYKQSNKPTQNNWWDGCKQWSLWTSPMQRTYTLKPPTPASIGIKITAYYHRRFNCDNKNLILGVD